MAAVQLGARVTPGLRTGNSRRCRNDAFDATIAQRRPPRKPPDRGRRLRPAPKVRYRFILPFARPEPAAATGRNIAMCFLRRTSMVDSDPAW